MANGLNTIIIKRDISSSGNSNKNNSNFQKDNNNFIKIEQSLKLNNNNTMIKRELIDSNTRIIKSQQNLLNNKLINSATTVVSPSGGSATNNINNNLSCGNTKMGSRRIFTPQFKLQVLESYRNDNDCKGNQRATARKYGIHRRQIQKWLQCESNLRTSVDNLNNQNNNNNNNNVIIKHQFHNISHHHNQQSINNNNNNQQYNKISSSTNNNGKSNIQLSLDSARHSVALNSIQTLSPPLTTPSSLTTVAAIPLISATTTQSSMARVAITSSSPSLLSPISIRTPIQINCNNNNNIGKSILQQQQQQQNTMPYLTNTPAINTSVSVPIPIIPTHSAAAAAAAAAYYHQYHLQIQHQHNNNNNDIVTSHNQHNHHHHHQHEQQNENHMPSSVSLPISTAATAIHQHNYHNATEQLIATVATTTTNQLHDYQPIYTTTATGNHPITLSSSNYDEFANTSSCRQEQQVKLNYENLYNDNNNNDYYQMQSMHQSQHQQQYDYIDRTIPSSSSSPIDLSLGHKKERDLSCNDTILDRKSINLKDYTKLIITKPEIKENNNYEQVKNVENVDDSLIVDLSFRKRKISVDDKYGDMPPEKVQKICDNVITTSSIIATKTKNDNDQLEENDHQQQQQQQQQPKPVKLFKPYLLDANTDDNIINNDLKKSEQQDPIIWSHHPSSNYDSQCSSRGSNFHGEYPFPSGSPIFSNSSQHYQQSHIITSSAAIQSPCSSSADSCCNRSTIVQSPISSVPSISPRSPCTTAPAATTPTFWCPKGSPVSGYDTASTYSDCSDYYKTTTKDIIGNYHSGEQQQQHIIQQSSAALTYSIDLKMHTIDNYYTNHHHNSNESINLIRSKSDREQFISQNNGLYRNHHVQRWLDHDSSDVRQGIAVYV